jgi:ABC-type multidrug transport system permease subunit
VLLVDTSLALDGDTVPIERNIFYRERSDGLYPTFAFFISYMSVEVPFDLITSLLFSIITYVVIGLNPLYSRFLIYWNVIFLIVFSGMLDGAMESWSDGAMLDQSLTVHVMY